MLIGSGTPELEDPPLIIRDPIVRDRRVVAKGSAHPAQYHGLLGPSGKPRGDEFFNAPETEKFVFTTERTPASLRETARRYAWVEVVPADGSGRVDLVEVVRKLPPLGVHHLLPEGGGELNFSMLQAGLVDEIFLTVCPLSSVVEPPRPPSTAWGFGRDQVRKLALKSHRVGARGEVFLHYDVLPGTVTVSANRLFPNGFELS